MHTCFHIRTHAYTYVHLYIHTHTYIPVHTYTCDRRERNTDITSQLEKADLKLQQLASTRQVYQEVDMKDAALADATKECDDCRQRDHLLRINMESLKRAMPRLLTKLTREIHPIPALEQVGTWMRTLTSMYTRTLVVFCMHAYLYMFQGV